MLSDIQKEKLTELMNNCPHEKLKPILLDAIPKWIKNESFPEQGALGIHFDTYQNKFKTNMFGGCCLLGATIVNESFTHETHAASEIRYKYNLSLGDYQSITDGFDGREYKGGSVSMWEYCREISKVIFNDM